MSARNDFQIMAKPVCGQCNLNCGYCYYNTKPQDLYAEQSKPLMPENVLEEYVRQYMAAKPTMADFSWQGGEPLLAGKDFFRRVIDLQKRFGRSGQRVGNALQTNGTLIDDEWCELFSEYKFLIGISLDGPAQFHNYYRKDYAGEGSFDRVWRGATLLNKHQVEFNVLTTLNAKNVNHGADVYRFFVNRGIRYLQFIPILERTPEGKPTDFSCPPDAYGRFMLDVFNLWLKKGVGIISERFFDSVLNTLVLGQPSLCWNMDACPRAYVLEWNGDLYACDHFVYKEWLMGNILETPMTELAASPVYDDFLRAKTELPRTCRECEYLRFCRGGCPKHFLTADRLDPDRANYFCESYKLFFRHALPEFKKIAQYIMKNTTSHRQEQ